MERDSDLPGPIDYLLIAVFGGIDVWAQPPRLGGARLTIDRTTEQERKDREPSPSVIAAADRWPGIRPPAQDPVKHYRFLVQPAFGTGAGRPFSIAINQRTGRIDWAYTDRYALAKEHRGSGVIGVALLSLPLALPLRAFDWYYRHKERSWGLSRHAKAILDGVGDKLTAEERAELERAFRLEWEEDQASEKIPTYDEARTRLSSLRQECTNGRDWSVEEAVPVRNYVWIDADGRGVARGREVGPTGACSVSIASAHFEGEEARRLLGCFLERHHSPPEPNDP